MLSQSPEDLPDFLSFDQLMPTGDTANNLPDWLSSMAGAQGPGPSLIPNSFGNGGNDFQGMAEWNANLDDALNWVLNEKPQ